MLYWYTIIPVTSQSWPLDSINHQWFIVQPCGATNACVSQFLSPWNIEGFKPRPPGQISPQPLRMIHHPSERYSSFSRSSKKSAAMWILPYVDLLCGYVTMLSNVWKSKWQQWQLPTPWHDHMVKSSPLQWQLPWRDRWKHMNRPNLQCIYIYTYMYIHSWYIDIDM